MRYFMAIGDKSQTVNTITGTDKSDILIGSRGPDFMTGGDGNDLMFGGWGDDVMLGGAGNDVLIGWHGNNYMAGGDGNDLIIGGRGQDKMFGDAGNDVLIAGVGDVAQGGADADTFIFSAFRKGEITISDFDAEEGDVMMIMGGQYFDWKVNDEVNYAEVSFENGFTLNLYGITAAEVMEDPGLFGL